MAPDSPHDPQTVSDIPSSFEKNGSTMGPQDNLHMFYESRDQPGHNGNASEQSTEEASMNNAVPSPLPMPAFHYGAAPPPAVIPRTKRTQCKNACTNCQKACKKCDDNRPCQRCTRYGTADTCVDSKRKERKKGLKRGPYKKRDGKADGEDEVSGDHAHPSVRGPGPALPYVGPVPYPPGMWSTYAPTGHGGKLEATGYYQPVFTLTPVGAPPTHGGEGGGSASGGGESQPYPFSFYPATFISYPGLPYPIPQAPGPLPPGFHFAYHGPGLFAPRPPSMANSNCEQNLSSSSANGRVKESADLNGVGGNEKEKAVESQVIEQVQVAESQAHDAARKEID